MPANSKTVLHQRCGALLPRRMFVQNASLAERLAHSILLERKAESFWNRLGGADGSPRDCWLYNAIMARPSTVPWIVKLQGGCHVRVMIGDLLSSVGGCGLLEAISPSLSGRWWHSRRNRPTPPGASSSMVGSPIRFPRPGYLLRHRCYSCWQAKSSHQTK